MKKTSLTLLSMAFMVACAVSEAGARIVVETVRGSVAVKTDANWQPVTQGMKLKEWAQVSAYGVNSSAIYHRLRTAIP